jgi:hypothetical protein
MGLRDANTWVSPSLCISVFVGLHRRVRLIKLQQTTFWRLVLVRPKLPPVQLPRRKRCWAPHLKLVHLQTKDMDVIRPKKSIKKNAMTYR